MGAALAIRDDIEAAELRRLARRGHDGRVAARLLAVANALEGPSRKAAAEAAGMARQTLRDWVIRYNAEGVEGLCDRPRSGRPPLLSAHQQAALKRSILRGPRPRRDGDISAWRIADLRRVVERRFRIRYQESGMPGLVHRPGLSWQTARASHPRADAAAQAAFQRGVWRAN
jgi:transposase